MSKLQQYDVVRIRQLIDPAKDYCGTQWFRRPPVVGDVGAIVEILNASGLPDSYMVECCGPEGSTIWLAEFSAAELELAKTGEPTP